MKNKKRKSLVAVTHTHTHDTFSENKGRVTKNKTIKTKLVVSITILLVILIIATTILLIWLNNEKNNKTISEVEEVSMQASVDTGMWDTNSVTVVKDTSMGYEINVPIPKGYVMSNVTGETEIKTGLVIYEGEEAVTDSNKDEAQKTRNQWVWVPVKASEMYGTDENGKKWGKLYDFNSNGFTPLNWSETNGVMKISGTGRYREPDIVRERDTDNYLIRYTNNYETGHELLKDVEIEFESIIESVEKYGGFYIGRYETGNLSQEIPAIVKGNTDISDQTWYSMYEKCKRIDEENKTIKTSMIYGSQWDATLKYLVESGSKTYEEVGEDSRSWGNYRNSTFEYINESGSTVTKSENADVRIPSGSSEYTKANNIYDLAGNVYDWTVEADNSFGRVLRGGRYSFTATISPAGYRGYSYSVNSNNFFGYRAILYIK